MWDFSWVTELSAWAGLGTLVLLEVVLGVDNLVFISILVGRLPAEQKRQAFFTGLGLALFMRLVLLAAIAWIIGLTEPLFSLGGRVFSARDLILMGGGVFLLFKGTLELHERLEGHLAAPADAGRHAGFWRVIAQIIALDAVFSLDSIITSVGMVDHVSIMMLAVAAAMLVMAVAAAPLLAFVERYPSVIVLCLGFLLMIGLSLLTDGLGYHIPKGYLYAAIIFAVLVEAANQWALRNRRKRISMRDMRESTARVVLGLLGGRSGHGDAQLDAAALAGEDGDALFAPEERDMVARVIRLSGRTARFIMIPRQRVNWLDSRADRETVYRFAASSSLPWLPVLRRETDDVLGVVRAGELLLPAPASSGASPGARWKLTDYIRPAPTIFEHTALADILDDFRAHPAPLSFVRDEYGSVVGLITPAELLSVLAGQVGDLPAGPEFCRQPDGSWRLPGRLSVDAVTAWLGISLPPRSTSATLAGLILERLGHIPVVGERLRLQGWELEIIRMDRQRIDEVRAVKTVPVGKAKRA
ncbi:TerC family protein [Desulfovibrio porci]|uniref:TerC family protein n=1 Tax=Desulfovibrio porci TaxID=2605782 RepID=UPI003A8EDDC5